MSIIKEDGSGRTDANSYATVESLRTYARGCGVDVSAFTDEQCAVLLIRSMDFLEGQRHRFKGYKANATQALQWPRADVWDIDFPGARFPSNAIPRELEYGQMALALEAMEHDLQPNQLPNTQGAIVREKVEGAIETVYANPSSPDCVPAFAKADALLSSLYKNKGLELVRT